MQQLNEVDFGQLKILDKVQSSVDGVDGTITGLDTIGRDDMITISWSSDLVMRFNHIWTDNINYIGE